MNCRRARREACKAHQSKELAKGLCAERSRPTEQPHAERRASPAHTAALIVVILAVAITGTLLTQRGALPALTAPQTAFANRIVSQYLPLLLVNVSLTLYVSTGFGRGCALSALLGRVPRSFARASGDLAWAGFAFLLIQLIARFGHAAGAGRNAALAALLPGTVAERLTWLLVAFSVGCCEEIVYRGYLQRQLIAFSGRVKVGILLQALLFGIAHAEQGVRAAAVIAVAGLVFGTLAWYRQSLVPGMVCHVAIDLLRGLSG